MRSSDTRTYTQQMRQPDVPHVWIVRGCTDESPRDTQVWNVSVHRTLCGAEDKLRRLANGFINHDLLEEDPDGQHDNTSNLEYWVEWCAVGNGLALLLATKDGGA